MPGHLTQFAHRIPVEQTAASGAGNRREQTLSMENRETYPEEDCQSAALLQAVILQFHQYSIYSTTTTSNLSQMPTDQEHCARLAAAISLAVPNLVIPAGQVEYLALVSSAQSL